MKNNKLVALGAAASYLGKSKQTLRRWDEEGKLTAIRGTNQYRYYDYGSLSKISNKCGKARPFVKWAGGKTQLLANLLRVVPEKYNTYLEPFVGGGALFFALQPESAVLNDSNEALMSAYLVIQNSPEELIHLLKSYKKKHCHDFFYEVRSTQIDPEDRLAMAARFIYLNKTCFNGLYRVNQKGLFNVPIGKYKNPPICDEDNIILCSKALKGVKLTCMDYKQFLVEYSCKGDFVYLDPPYIPVSVYSDFDRYSKEKFRIGDQIELSLQYKNLVERGVYAVLSNSDSPYTENFYSGFEKDKVSAGRAINKKGKLRGKIGEIIILPKPKGNSLFPASRYMGSKTKLLPHITNTLKGLGIQSVFDAFSGSGVVSYHLKKSGYQVISNDFLRYSASITKAVIENQNIILTSDDIRYLLQKRKGSGKFIQTTFDGLYFSNDDNKFLDFALHNILSLDCEYKRALGLSALSRACLKRRPRGIFTYVGFRYDDGRKDLSFSLKEHFLFSIAVFNKAVFDNGHKNISLNASIMEMEPVKADLIYLDPPYFSKHSDNDYVRRYHFIEGLCRNWEGLEIQEHTKTKKFKKFESPFNSRVQTYEALDWIFRKYQDSRFLVSYSSNSLPTKEEMIAIISKYKSNIEVKEIDYSYSFGNQGHKIRNNNNSVQEYLFLAT